jgi:hypothetical protein
MKKALFTKDYSKRSQFARSFLAESGCIVGIYIYPKNREKDIEKVDVYQYFNYENIGDTDNWLRINSLLSDQTAVIFDNCEGPIELLQDSGIIVKYNDVTKYKEALENLKKESADAVENYLLEEAKKLTGTQKVRGLLVPPTPENEPKKSHSPTLTASMSQQATPVADDSLSDDESKRRIAAMLKWQE